MITIALSGLIAAAPDPAPVIIDLKTPTPVALDLSYGEGYSGAESLSELSALVSDALDRMTSARPLPLSSVAVATCRQRLGNAHITVCTVKAALEAVSGKAPLLFVQTVGRGPSSALRAGWLDLEALRSDFGTRLYETQIAHDPEASLRALARELVAATVWTGRTFAPTREMAAAALDGFLREDFRSQLEKAGLLRGGELSVHVDPSGQLEIDGKAHPAASSRFLVRGLTLESHTVRVPATDGYLAAEQSWTPRLDVADELRLTRRRDYGPSWNNMALAGCISLGLGAAATTFGLLEAPNRPQRLADEHLIRLLPPPTPSQTDQGPVVAGVAAGLLVTGVGFTIAQLWKDERRPPWWELALSLAAGVAVVTTVELFEASR